MGEERGGEEKSLALDDHAAEEQDVAVLDQQGFHIEQGGAAARPPEPPARFAEMNPAPRAACG